MPGFRRGLSVVFVQLLLSLLVDGASFESSSVLKLTTKNFDEQVSASLLSCKCPMGFAVL